ncbi:MAG TPA: hypothetical protein VGJ32_16150, partial [Solirubrobacteraceae bacterium]
PSALAQDNPFAPLPQAPPDTSTIPIQTTANTAQDDGGGLGTLGDILIYGTGAIVLFGMGWLIVRDARRRAPVEERVSQPTGTHSPQRHARARAKAKAARAQRKRNRAKR